MGAQKIEAKLNSIREQLTHFGLNPIEWQVFAQRENIYQLAHREDPSFKINAQVRSLQCGFVRVDQLTVVSL